MTLKCAGRAGRNDMAPTLETRHMFTPPRRLVQCVTG